MNVKYNGLRVEGRALFGTCEGTKPMVYSLGNYYRHHNDWDNYGQYRGVTENIPEVLKQDVLKASICEDMAFVLQVSRTTGRPLKVHKKDLTSSYAR